MERTLQFIIGNTDREPFCNIGIRKQVSEVSVARKGAESLRVEAHRAEEKDQTFPNVLTQARPKSSRSRGREVRGSVVSVGKSTVRIRTIVAVRGKGYRSTGVH